MNLEVQNYEFEKGKDFFYLCMSPVIIKRSLLTLLVNKKMCMIDTLIYHIVKRQLRPILRPLIVIEIVMEHDMT